MDLLMEAIQRCFTGHSGPGSLHELLSGRFYWRIAPQSVSLPYGVYFLVSGADDRDWSSGMLDCQVQMTVFAASAELLSQISRAVDDLYSDRVLSFVDPQAEPVGCTRQGPPIVFVADKVWQAVHSYRIRVGLVARPQSR